MNQKLAHISSAIVSISFLEQQTGLAFLYLYLAATPLPDRVCAPLDTKALGRSRFVL